MKFSDIVGLKTVKDNLIQGHHNNMLSHAMMFVGPEGYGGLALAIAFAQYLNCENPEEYDSCGVCASCQKMAKLIHPDVHFTYPTINDTDKKIKPLSKNYLGIWRDTVLESPYFNYFDWMGKLKSDKQGNISVDDCHEVIKNLSLKAFGGKNKIQIIWYADLLSSQANALLKIVEEPPQGTYFIFISRKIESVLKTILSRTQVILLPRLTDDEIAGMLIDKSGLQIDEAKRISWLADGDYVEANKIVKSGKNIHETGFIDWLRLCYQFKPAEIWNWLGTHVEKGKDYSKDFLQYGLRMLREILLLGNDLPELSHVSEAERESLIKLSKLLKSESYDMISEKFSKAHYHVERNANLKILFFNLSLNLHKILNQR